jgi:hypothetical protein
VLGPGDVPLVKRVAREAAPGRAPTAASEPLFEVLGDNAGASLDSRAFGPIGRARFVGRVFFRYWPPSRVGPVR